MGFLSSSELNRCKKNDLCVWEVNNWFEVIKQPWLNRKLRRKIGFLWNCHLLKELPAKPLIGLNDMDYSVFDLPQFRGMRENLAKQYLAAEDEFILKGLGK
jgi:hypothetical protein